MNLPPLKRPEIQLALIWTALVMSVIVLVIDQKTKMDILKAIDDYKKGPVDDTGSEEEAPVVFWSDSVAVDPVYSALHPRVEKEASVKPATNTTRARRPKTNVVRTPEDPERLSQKLVFVQDDVTIPGWKGSPEAGQDA